MRGIIQTTTYHPVDEFIRNKSRTHKAGPSGNTRDLYSGGAQFEFRLGHEVPWQVFCSCPQAIQRKALAVPQIRWQLLQVFQNVMLCQMAKSDQNFQDEGTMILWNLKYDDDDPSEHPICHTIHTFFLTLWMSS
jgi:hypothetical protein